MPGGHLGLFMGRSALAEHWAFVFAPLVLWIAVEERLAPRRRVALGALAENCYWQRSVDELDRISAEAVAAARATGDRAGALPNIRLAGRAAR